jgi:hypothetical protein
VAFVAVRRYSLRAQIVLLCPPLIAISRQITPALLHGLLHFPVPNTRLVDARQLGLFTCIDTIDSNDSN